MGKKKKSSKKDFNRDIMAGASVYGSDAQKLLKRYGVKGYSHGRTDRGSTYRGVDEVRKDLANAMMNDYDTRRTMEAAAMAGNKGAKKFAKKGIKAGKIQDAYGVMQDLKKEYVGGGGMDGAKNRAGLTYAAVKADRDKQTEDYDAKYASQKMLEDKLAELKEGLKSKEEETIEYVESDRLKSAKERLAGDTYNDTDSLFKGSAPTVDPTTAFRKENDSAPTTDDRQRATSSYLEQYKKDVLTGGNIKSATKQNLTNAYNTVARLGL